MLSVFRCKRIRFSKCGKILNLTKFIFSDTIHVPAYVWQSVLNMFAVLNASVYEKPNVCQRLEKVLKIKMLSVLDWIQF